MLVVWVLYVTPAFLLNIPVVQEEISRVASDQLKEKLGVDVHISRVDFELFNKLILKDVYLEDQHGEPLLKARRVAVGFDFLPLFKGKLLFSSAQLFSFEVNLSKETAESPLNLQFIIDAFAKKDKTKKDSGIDLHIRNLNLRRGYFSYHIKDAAETPGKFNPKHIELKDISAKIHINELRNNLLNANIDRLAFTEKSGFRVDRLILDLHANNKKAFIKKLEIKLPNSELRMDSISAEYGHISDIHRFIQEANFNLNIIPSDITLQDISPFIPVFSNYNDPVTLQGHLFGNMSKMTLENFYLSDKDKLMLRANIELNNLTDAQSIYINGAIEESFISSAGIEKISNNFNTRNPEIPAPIYQLGNITFEGKISGYLHDLSAYGIFNTDIGSLRTDIKIGQEKNLFVKGNISTNGINLKKLFNNNPDLGNASFNITVDAQQTENKQFYGKIHANIGRFEFKKYSYENIDLIGDFTNKSFDGTFNIDSPEGKISSEGFFRLNGETSEFNFLATAQHIKLDKLNLSNKYKESDLSFNINANFTGNNIDNLIGEISLNDLKFNTEKGGYYLDTLEIKAIEHNNTEKLLTINSDIINGEIQGIYSFRSIASAIKQSMGIYLPSLISPSGKNWEGMENNFSIDLTISDLEEFSYILDLPFTTYSKSKLVGQYNSIYNKFRLEGYFPRFNIKNMKFESGMMLLENPGTSAHITFKATNLGKNDKKIIFSSDFTAFNDSINTFLKWSDPSNHNMQGNFSFDTKFATRDGNYPLSTTIHINESNIAINDSIWRIHPSSLMLDSGKIMISDLMINHVDQFLKINGTISKNMEDVLYLDLNRLSLDYIFKSLNKDNLNFGGFASGFVHARDLFNTRQLTTELDVKDFSFNNVVFGDLDLSGAWNDTAQGIEMTGYVFKNDSSFVNVKGLIFPVKEELSFSFNAVNGNAAFLRKYLDNVAKNITGEVSGNVRLFGTFKNLTLEGNVFAKNTSFDIEFLNTRYTFTDSVKIKPDSILINNVTINDKFGNKAIVKGYVTHKYLDDVKFSADIKTNNLLIFNATSKQNPSFYGTAFGTGTASIRGNEKVVNIDVSMESNRNTKIGLNFMEESDLSEYDFINYVTEKKDSIPVSDHLFSILGTKPILMKTDSKAEIIFNLILNATPDATIELVMDPVSGDKIKGYGRGTMQIKYGTKSPLKMFGNYVIHSGTYNFSLQQVKFWDFSIREGSSIIFKGNPYTAAVDLDAIYTLSANLGDLDPNLIEDSPRTNVLVDCVLGINGELSHPDIKFDIQLPGSNHELERKVKNLINTEDMMNRQIIYLLVLNKFTTAQENIANSPRNNDFASLASATLSSQLSSLLGSLSESFQIGTRIKTSDSEFTDTEVALLLSSQLLDNRLIFNGNFGYRDNPNMRENKSKFVGDFDLEYKLNRSGEIRLKAYNHYNDSYYNLKTANTTQGLGIMFKKDFDKIESLFFRRKKIPVTPQEPSPVPQAPDNKPDTIPVSYTNKKDDFIFFKLEN